MFLSFFVLVLHWYFQIKVSSFTRFLSKVVRNLAQLGVKLTSWVPNLPDHEHRIPINLFGFSLIFLNNDYFVYKSYIYFATFITRNLTDCSIVIFILNSPFKNFKYFQNFKVFIVELFVGKSSLLKLASRLAPPYHLHIVNIILEILSLHNNTRKDIKALCLEKTVMI